jgi:hypothetical protein
MKYAIVNLLRSCLKKRAHILAIGILAAHMMLLAYGAARHSPHPDEVAHFAAGISHWELKRFDLFRVNPPLIRLIATLPPWMLGVNTDWTEYSDTPGTRQEFRIAKQMLVLNRERIMQLFFAARLPLIFFSALGGWICYRWSSDRYGAAGGLCTVILWCICPNVLAHGQTIGPDVGAAALAVTASYAFMRWLREPSWPHALVWGVALGIAELTKTSLIVLLPIQVGLWLVLCLVRQIHAQLWQGLQIATVLVIALYVINLCYGFEKTLMPLGQYTFLSRSLSGDETRRSWPGETGNRFASTWLGAIPIPLPANYLIGVDEQKRDFEQKTWSYLRGEWRLGGWWYYYLYAFAIKVPCGTLVLVCMSTAMAIRKGFCSFSRSIGDVSSGTRISQAIEDLGILIPPLAILFLVSSQTGVNHHLRYILPALPFLFVWAGRAGQFLGRLSARGIAVALCVVWATVSSLSIYPHSMSYFNELVGGPKYGHLHLCGELVDSNIDWGQDLLYLKRWLDSNPTARPVRIAFNGPCDPSLFNISYDQVPPSLTAPAARHLDESHIGPVPGWHAISVSMLHRRDRMFDYFDEFQPVAMIGYSIYIFYIEEADANRVRQRLGLPPSQREQTEPQ